MKFGKYECEESVDGPWEQCFIRFPNGYGASIIRGPHTYGGRDGLWEVAVMSHDHRILYNTPVTNDVIGHLEETEVAAVLGDIEALLPRSVS